jgi:hypothetical protein
MVNENELSLEVDNTVEAYAGFTVNGPAEYAKAGESVILINGKIGRIIDYWKGLKDKAYKAHQDVCKKEKDMLLPLKSLKAEIEGSANKYLAEEDRKQRKIEADAKRVADAEAERERKDLLKRAERVKTPAKKEELTQKAEEVYVKPVVIDHTIEKTTQVSSGSTTRKVETQITIVDKLKLIQAVADGSVPASIISIEETKLKKWIALEEKTGEEVPGTLIEKVSKMGTRRSK